MLEAFPDPDFVGGGVIRLSADADTPEEGEILVSSEGIGFIGRVVSVEVDADGTQIVKTEPATLAEAFPSGEISGSLVIEETVEAVIGDDDELIGLSGTTQGMRLGAVKCGADIKRGDTVSLDINYRPNVSLSWGPFTDDTFEAFGEITATARLALPSAELDAKCTLRLWGPIVLAPVYIGPVPLTPALSAELTLSASVPILDLPSLELSASGKVGAGWSQSRGAYRITEFGLGHKVTGGSFSEILPFGSSAKVRGEVGFRVQFLVFALLGPAVTTKVFVETTVQQAAPWLSVDAGIVMEASIDLQLWVVNLSLRLVALEFGRINLFRASDQWPGPVIDTVLLQGGKENEAYVQALTTLRNDPVTWEATGLPPGLDIDQASRSIIGTPQRAGIFSVRVTATDVANGLIDSRRYRLRIVPRDPPVPPSNVSPPTISLPDGAAQPIVGDLLRANRGTWTGDEPMEFEVQWQRCNPNCTDVADAVGDTYRLTDDDAGATIRLRETATNLGDTVSAVSAETTPVMRYVWTREASLGLARQDDPTVVCPTTADRCYSTHGSAFLVTNDGGQTWTDLSPNLGPDARWVGSPTCPTADTCFMNVGTFDSSALMRTDDGGVTWTEVSTTGRVGLLDCPTVSFCATVIWNPSIPDAELQFSTDGAQTWQPRPTIDGYMLLERMLRCPSDGVCYVGAIRTVGDFPRPYALVRFDADAADPTLMPISARSWSSLLGFDCSSADRCVVVTDNQTFSGQQLEVHVTESPGEGWRTLDLGSYQRAAQGTAVACAPGGPCWLPMLGFTPSTPVGDQNPGTRYGALQITLSGEIGLWREYSEFGFYPVPDPIGIACPAPEMCVQGSARGAGVAYRMVPPAAQWQQVTTPSNIGRIEASDCWNDVECVVVNETGLVWFLSGDGSSARSSQIPVGPPSYLVDPDISCPRADTCFVSSAGGIHKTVDGGSTWSVEYGHSSAALEEGPVVSVQRINCVSETHCVGIGILFDQSASSLEYPAASLSTRDGGATWEIGLVPNNTTSVFRTFSALTCVSETHCWATQQGTTWPIDQPGLVVRTIDGGRTWYTVRLAPSSSRMFISCTASSFCVLSVTEFGRDATIYRSFDGTNWELYESLQTLVDSRDLGLFEVVCESEIRCRMIGYSSVLSTRDGDYWVEEPLPSSARSGDTRPPTLRSYERALSVPAGLLVPVLQ